MEWVIEHNNNVHKKICSNGIYPIYIDQCRLCIYRTKHHHHCVQVFGRFSVNGAVFCEISVDGNEMKNKLRAIKEKEREKSDVSRSEFKPKKCWRNINKMYNNSCGTNGERERKEHTIKIIEPRNINSHCRLWAIANKLIPYFILDANSNGHISLMALFRLE